MFEKLFLKALDKHAPVKKRVVRANHAKYISKPLRKAIMKRSYLEKIYFKKKTTQSLEKYKKQKNYCSRLYKKERKKFFNNLNTSFVNDNKLFWKTVKPFCSNKGSFGNKIKPVEKDEVWLDDSKIAEEMNNFFKNTVSTLDIKENSFIINHYNSHITDSVEKAIEKYKFHPSILLIKKKTECVADSFDFVSVSVDEVEKVIKRLNPNKATTFNTIPLKMLTKTSETSAKIIHKVFNETVETGDYPDNLKLADITPVFKKKDPLNKINYRPVSVLPSISKLFEKLMQHQLVNYMENYLSPHLCGYRKGYSSQQALMSLIESWKKSLDKKGYGGAISMDLSKAFDTIKHNLLLAKLHAYGFSKKTLKLIHNYLSNTWHRTKINKDFSTWQELLQGVPQGSVLGPLLFDIYLNDLFFLTESTNKCNFAGDTTFYACDRNLNNLINRLEHDSFLATEWFENNSMKLNDDKCHLLVSGHKYENVWAQIGKAKIWESKTQKLLGVEIERTLNFDKHVKSLCKKAGRKLSVLSRLSSYMTVKQKKILMKSFFKSQFGYCPLV